MGLSCSSPLVTFISSKIFIKLDVNICYYRPLKLNIFSISFQNSNKNMAVDWTSELVAIVYRIFNSVQDISVWKNMFQKYATFYEGLSQLKQHGGWAIPTIILRFYCDNHWTIVTTHVKFYREMDHTHTNKFCVRLSVGLLC